MKQVQHFPLKANPILQTRTRMLWLRKLWRCLTYSYGSFLASFHFLIISISNNISLFQILSVLLFWFLHYISVKK